MSLLKKHMERHHNPRSHAVAGAFAAAGAWIFASRGYTILAVLVALLAAVNVFHAINEHRRPRHRTEFADAHLNRLRGEVGRGRSE
jgi:hypothetical protein